MNINNTPAVVDPTYSFVHRIVDKGKTRAIFYVAGLSELGTIGAMGYLARNWKALERVYRSDKSFLIMLRQWKWHLLNLFLGEHRKNVAMDLNLYARW